MSTRGTTFGAAASKQGDSTDTVTTGFASQFVGDKAIINKEKTFANSRTREKLARLKGPDVDMTKLSKMLDAYENQYYGSYEQRLRDEAHKTGPDIYQQAVTDNNTQFDTMAKAQDEAYIRDLDRVGVSLNSDQQKAIGRRRVLSNALARATGGNATKDTAIALNQNAAKEYVNLQRGKLAKAADQVSQAEQMSNSRKGINSQAPKPNVAMNAASGAAMGYSMSGGNPYGALAGAVYGLVASM